MRRRTPPRERVPVRTRARPGRRWSRRFLGLALALLLSIAAVSAASPPRAFAETGAADLILAPEGGPVGPVQLPPLPEDYLRVERDSVTWDFPASAIERVRPLMGAFRSEWTRIASDLGERLDPRLHVRVVRDADEMRALAPPGMPPPSYASGVAYPSLGLILLSMTAPFGGDPPQIERVFVHELSHVALHRAVGGHPVPRWFTEGLAIQHAREHSFERVKVLAAAAYESQRIPLSQLSGRFPDGPTQVDLAYAQSADLVRFLMDDPRGQTKLRRLVRSLRDGLSFSDALFESYYMRPAQLERDWVEDLRSRSRVYPLLVGGSLAWVLAAILLPVAYLRRRKRAKLKLQRMALREEKDRLEAERLARERFQREQVRRAQVLARALAAQREASEAEASAAARRAASVATERLDEDDLLDDGAPRPKRPRREAGAPLPILPGDEERGVPVVRVGDEVHTLH